LMIPFSGRLWSAFGDEDFVPNDPDFPTSMGAISNQCKSDIHRLSKAAQEALPHARVKSGPLREDSMIRTLEDHLYSVVGQVGDKGTRAQCLLLFMLVQRFFLEINARWSWLDVYKLRFIHQGRDYVLSVSSIMGAYTDNVLHAQALYKAGIPVWLVKNREQIRDASDYNWVPCRGRLEWARAIWPGLGGWIDTKGRGPVWEEQWFSPDRLKLTNRFISSTLAYNPWAIAAMREGRTLDSASSVAQNSQPSLVGPSRTVTIKGSFFHRLSLSLY
jgi:hypothetical protein